MLKKEYRLTRRNDFRKVYQRGKTAVSRCLVLYVAPSRNETMRIGFSVSKKIGKAVVRNRIKRQMRAAARDLLPAFSPQKDYVFIARAGIKDKSFAEIEKQMAALLKKVKENNFTAKPKNTPKNTQN